MPISFLCLPGTVRNKIYRCALVLQSPHETRCPIVPSSPSGPWRYRRAFLHNRFRHGRYEAFFEPSFRLSIFRVCRIVSSEALSIFYGDNVFWFVCEPLGPPKIDFKIGNSKHCFRGIKWQQKLALAYIKSISCLTPRIFHEKLGCGSSTIYWRKRLQHVGLIMYYDDYFVDRFEKPVSSAISLAGLLRDLAISGVALKTAKLDLRFGDYCEPEAFAAGSKLMKAALALDVGERIVITVSRYNDVTKGGFANALAENKDWELAATKLTYGSNGVELARPDANQSDSMSRRKAIEETDPTLEEEEDPEHAAHDVYTWRLFPPTLRSL
ncbi:hypothetical protein G7Y79_00038g075060 [Physcia stellaris]|nr:hypothetical protein G7Y79_00038g075060 [Physcia stellaris]